MSCYIIIWQITVIVFYELSGKGGKDGAYIVITKQEN